MSAPELFDYLDGKLNAEERAAFEQRIASEPALLADLQAALEMEDGFAALRKIAPPEDLLARTRREINAGKTIVAESKQTRTSHRWMWPAVAAALVICGFVFFAKQQQITTSAFYGFDRDEPKKENPRLAETGETSARPTTTRSRTLEMKDEGAGLSAPAAPVPASPAIATKEQPLLREQIEAAAKKNLPEPKLAAEQIAIDSPSAEIANRADEIIRAADSMGGFAFKTENNESEWHLLAYIPQDELENFRKAIVSAVPERLAGAIAMDRLSESERAGVQKELSETRNAYKPAPLSSDLSFQNQDAGAEKFTHGMAAPTAGISASAGDEFARKKLPSQKAVEQSRLIARGMADAKSDETILQLEDNSKQLVESQNKQQPARAGAPLAQSGDKSIALQKATLGKKKELNLKETGNLEAAAKGKTPGPSGTNAFVLWKTRDGTEKPKELVEVIIRRAAEK